MAMGSEMLTGAWWDWIPKSLDQWDRRAYEAVAAWVPAPISFVLQKITESPAIITIFVLGFLGFVFWKKVSWRNPFLIGMVMVILLDFCIDIWLKDAFGRIKPYLTTRYTPPSHAALSFPSAHAANFGFMAAYLYNHRRVAAFFGVMAVVVAMLRVLAGRHYPLDVIGGLLLGGGMGWGCRWVYLWVKAHYFVK